MSDHYREVEVVGPGLTEFLRLLTETRVNGATYVRRFRWAGDLDDWPSTGTPEPFETSTTFASLIGSDAARRAMPDVMDSSHLRDPPPRFERVRGGALGLDGDFATLLVLGGAYEKFNGAQREAKEVAGAAVRDLIQHRYEDFWVFHSHRPWSSWFHAVAWDQTWLLVDTRNAETTIICTTDTD